MRGTVMASGKNPMKTTVNSEFPAPHGALPGASGLRLRPGYLDRARQQELLAALREIFEAAPLFTPRMPRWRPFTVRMSNCGRLGWISDECGYRYQAAHPFTGRPWPPIPDILPACGTTLPAIPARQRRV